MCFCFSVMLFAPLCSVLARFCCSRFKSLCVPALANKVSMYLSAMSALSCMTWFATLLPVETRLLPSARSVSIECTIRAKAFSYSGSRFSSNSGAPWRHASITSSGLDISPFRSFCSSFKLCFSKGFSRSVLVWLFGPSFIAQVRFYVVSRVVNFPYSCQRILLRMTDWALSHKAIEV